MARADFRMGEHREWIIRITPRERNDMWTASVEVWPPGTDRHNTGALIVPFSDSSPDMERLIGSSMAVACRYIDVAIRR